MSPEPAIDPGQKPPSRPLLRFEGDQKPISSPRGVSQTAATIYVTEAGRAQAYLVAAGARGHNAAHSAAAAYEQIARELKKRASPDPSRTSLRKLGGVAHRQVGAAASAPVPGPGCGWPPHLYPGPASLGQGPLRGHHPGGPETATHGPDLDHPAPGLARGPGLAAAGHTTLILQNLQGMGLGGNGWNRPPVQARQLLALANRILREQGATYRDVVRTWFYLDDILSWYPDFNQARSAVYRELGILSPDGDQCRKLPASTGIQGIIPSGAACALDLMAVIPAAKFTAASSPTEQPRPAGGLSATGPPFPGGH